MSLGSTTFNMGSKLNSQALKFIDFVLYSANEYQREDCFHEITPDQLDGIREVLINIREKYHNDWINAYINEEKARKHKFADYRAPPPYAKISSFVNNVINVRETRANLKKHYRILIWLLRKGMNTYRKATTQRQPPTKHKKKPLTASKIITQPNFKKRKRIQQEEEEEEEEDVQGSQDLEEQQLLKPPPKKKQKKKIKFQSHTAPEDNTDEEEEEDEEESMSDDDDE